MKSIMKVNLIETDMEAEESWAEATIGWQPKGDQRGSYCISPDEKCWWLRPEWCRGDGEKSSDSGYILKKEMTGFC